MFKRFINWFSSIFPKSEDAVDSILDAFDDDFREYVKDIRTGFDSEKKQFLVELTVGPDTKLRPLKAAIETAVSDMLRKQYPECSDDTVKFFYYRNA